ncbi:V-type ATP synthase subunit D [bacterium]|jgi:V/A-type H+/Na+-transporting ATPase subunit D|nr:V-type ATP synthase subunit D [bacterium]MBT6831862.1 V-type ATP synthase subunit D [bacterium]MBT6996516.1 V-type ATP synthase subunit D [bacterium]MBT7773009.1 V-type ATP synthase subunit D [bacterium]
MAIKNVTATRMTMLGLKKQAVTAKRGHKLLKDKQDGLMQEFMQIIRKCREVRVLVEEAVITANTAFLEAQAIVPKSVLENALSVPAQKLSLEVETKNVMSVRIPVFKLHTEKSGLGYGFFQTRAELDLAIKAFIKVFELLIQLAEIEKSAENLAVEIEKTRRRVNALEHRLIPDIEDTLRFISMKLGETERSAIVQVMAIKAMIERNEAVAQHKKNQKNAA